MNMFRQGINLFLLIQLSFVIGREWQHSKIYSAKELPVNYQSVLTGLDVLELNRFDILQNKSVGLISNHTSINRFDRHLTDLIIANRKIHVPVIFTPEHGFKGNLGAGEIVKDQQKYLKAKVVSLYGKNKKPKKVDLNGLDILVFDLQDVGARYYTYSSTLTLVMKAAAENSIPMIVLDRPNPLRGDKIQGPLLKMEFSSFVGMHPIPIRHGLTMGELAVMINENGWLGENLYADLTVVPIKGWERDMWYDETGFYWKPPSPNLPSFNAALAYIGTCLLEGTNVSEGRGTYSPFLNIGAPWIDANKFTKELQKLDLTGVQFHPHSFMPISMSDRAKYPKFENQECFGTRVRIRNKNSFNPLLTGVGLLLTLQIMYPNEFKWEQNLFIDKLYGSDYLRKFVEQERNILSFDPLWQDDQFEFYEFRKPFLIYGE